MPSSRVARGRRTEEAVAQYLRDHGWPTAERAPAGLPGKDIRKAPRLAPEVKATGGFSPLAFVRQAKANAATGELPFVVYRPNESGEGDVEAWLGIVPFGVLVELLAAAGYTTPEGTPTP